ncbi:Heavy metal-associated domain, HMA [Artemisia annua]|uniref:Heavy metal-associated domain, HMA n=1 Tax=Artemisia annua TaxID=35608 RepID=A0A2U1PK17_ARTAN|nr:Heavy metal-associated domain, HMA [Artemisia annua]
MQKTRVTKIQVRIDCNGCVQKIKKALLGINGINDIYIDIPRQKLTIIGWADPETIIKAIKRTRKFVSICLEGEPSPPTEQPSGGGAPPPDHPSDPAIEETVKPLKEEESQPPTTKYGQDCAPPQPLGSKEAEEIHIVQHYPPDHGQGYNHRVLYNESIEHYSSPPSPLYKPEPPQAMHVNHSYNKYKPTPYVTEYTHIRPPPQYNRSEPRPQQYTRYNKPEQPQEYTQYNQPEPLQEYTQYNRPEPPLHYTHYRKPESPQPYTNFSREESPPQYARDMEVYHGSSYGNHGHVTSIFSDENPNACTIV